jgi:hypothetical protein
MNPHFVMKDCPSFLSPPPFDPTLLLENRSRLQSILQDYLNEEEASEDVSQVHILLASAQRPVRTEADSEYPSFRQTSALMYLLGEFQISPSLVLLSANVSHSTTNGTLSELVLGPFEFTLFLPNSTHRELIFTGNFPSEKVLKKEFLVDHVTTLDQLMTHSSTFWIPSSSLTDYAALFPSQTLPPSLHLVQKSWINKGFKKARFIKSKKELELLRHASRVAAWAHSHLADRIHSGHPTNGEFFLGMDF